MAVVVVLDVILIFVECIVLGSEHLQSSGSSGQVMDLPIANTLVWGYYLVLGSINAFFRMDLYDQRQKLKAELAKFEVRNVKAWCCEVSHVLPDGTRIPCDRDFVEASIKTWYGEDNRDGLDEFNDQVRTQLSTQVADLLGKESVLSWQLAVLISTLLVWGQIGRVLLRSGQGDDVAMFSLGRRICLAAQNYVGFLPMFIFADAVSAFTLVWLYRRNVPMFRSFFVILSAFLFATSQRYGLAIWGVRPFPQHFAEYKPPHWVQAWMFIGSVPLIALQRSLAK